MIQDEKALLNSAYGISDRAYELMQQAEAELQTIFSALEATAFYNQTKVLAAFLPDEAYMKLMRYERYGILILLALSWLGLGGNALGNAIYSVYEALFHIFFA